MSLAGSLYKNAFDLYDQTNFSNVSVAGAPDSGALNDNNVVKIDWPKIMSSTPKVDNYSRVFYDFQAGKLSGNITLTVINYNDVYKAWYDANKKQVDYRLLPNKSGLKVYTISFNDDAGNNHSLNGMLTEVSSLAFDKTISSSVPTFTLTFIPMMGEKA